MDTFIDDREEYDDTDRQLLEQEEEQIYMYYNDRKLYIYYNDIKDYVYE
jgi:hypothetical protein